MSDEAVVRVAAIVDALAPLGDATAGEPVRAEDWNAVVGAVSELARLVLVRERTIETAVAGRFAPADHDHLAAVGADWLDATTRDLLEGGRRGRADLAADIARLGDHLARTTTELRALRDEVDDVKRRLLELDDRSEGATRRVDRLASVSDAVAEQATSLGDVRRTVNGLDERVREALELRNQLTDATGEPLDLAQLRAEVDELRTVRDRLVTAAGDVVDIREVERRLVRLERVDAATGGGADLDALRTEILTEVDTRLEGRVGELRGELRDDLDGARSELADLRASVEANAAGLDATRAGLVEHDQRLVALQGATAGIPDLTVRLAATEARVQLQGTRLDGFDLVGERVAALEGAVERLAPIGARLDELAAEVGQHAATLSALPQLAERVDGLELLRADVKDLAVRMDGAIATATRAEATVHDSVERLTVVEARTADHAKRVATLESRERSREPSRPHR